MRIIGRSLVPDQTKVRRDLRNSFKWYNMPRVMWLVLATGDLYFLLIIVTELSNGIQPDASMVLTFLITSGTVLCFAGVFYLGPPDISKAVNSIEPTPDAECLLLLLQSLAYAVPRRFAWPKLVKILASIDAEETKRIPLRLWRRYYKQAATKAVEHATIVFDNAARLQHREAIPYLRSVLLRDDIRDTDKEQLKISLIRLEHTE